MIGFCPYRVRAVIIIVFCQLEGISLQEKTFFSNKFRFFPWECVTIGNLLSLYAVVIMPVKIGLDKNENKR